MEFDNCTGHLTRLEKAATAAAYQNRNVFGLVGDQINQLANTLTCLGRELYEHWDDSWVDQSNGEDIIVQQADGLNACRELHKALKHLIDIFQFRHFEHRKAAQKALGQRKPQFKSIVRSMAEGAPPVLEPASMPVLTPTLASACWPGTSNAASTSQTSPLFRNGVAPNEAAKDQRPIKDAKDIKEEPMDIKDEPVDEGYPEVKQEEDPISDVFCPTTGIARQVYLQCHEQLNRSGTSEQPSRSTLVSASKRLVVNGSVGVTRDTVEQLERCRRPFFANQLVDRITVDPLKEKYADTREPRVCYLCNRWTDKYLSTPQNEINRYNFIKRIILLTPKDRARIAELQQNSQVVHFCLIHVASRAIPSSPPPPQLPDTEEEKRLKEALTIPINFKPTFNRQTIAESNLRPPEKQKAYRSRKCDLCGERAIVPFCFSPKDMTVARKFFDNLIDVTQRGLDIIEWHLAHEKRATVCRKHIKEPPKINKTIPQKQSLNNGKFDLLASAQNLLQRREKRRGGEVTELETPELVVVAGNKRKQKFQERLDPITVFAGHADPMRSLKTLVKCAPKFDEETIKEEPADEPGPSGIR